MSRDDQWLEKYNRLNDFFQKHDHTKVPYARITDNSLYHWVQYQRQRYKMESRIKLLNAIGFIFSESIPTKKEFFKYKKLKSNNAALWKYAQRDA